MAAACRDLGLLRAYNPCYQCPHMHDKAKCKNLTPSLGLPDHCRQIDVHSLVASKVFAKEIGDTPIWDIDKKFKSLRSIAKAVNFLLVYGGSEPTLAQRTGITLDEAKRVFKEYFAAFPGIKSWIRAMYNFALKNGYSQDVLGRRRYYEALLDKNFDSAACAFTKEPYANEELRIVNMKYGGEYYREVMGAMRKAQNHPIQGSAAEMTKQGSLYANTRFKSLPFRASILGFVHD